MFDTGGTGEGFLFKEGVWIFKESMYIGDGPSMNFVRISHACGLYQSSIHDGNPMIVVAGSLGGSGRKTSEFWDFTVPGSKWTITSKSYTFLCFFKSFHLEIFALILLPIYISDHALDSECNS